MWSKQRCVISFEVSVSTLFLHKAKQVNTDWVNVLAASGKEPANALAEARAAQILAEMLGMVCHPEYFSEEKEQTVIVTCSSSLADPIGNCRSL